MLWIKSFHLVFVVSWFAGLFYLPRIFVNLAQEENPAAHTRLLRMGEKLYRFMTLIAIVALILGLWLWLGYGVGQGEAWLYTKLFVVLLLAGYHHACGRLLKKFTRNENRHSHNWYRWFNEVPVLLLIAATVLAVVKPF
ncbi:MAG TPA: CopD family protein [Burkholderiales bacterium]|nr:CopD family protein [Burkholderiales bacterium]